MFAWAKKYWLPWTGFVIALGFHLWHLGSPTTFISDEFYFVQESQKYLTQTFYVDAHPPLGKLQEGFLFTLFGSTPITWRIINAAQGALMVPLVWWVMILITKRPRAAALATTFILVDGFLLAESRAGMINIPYIFYSLVALAGILKSLAGKYSRRWLWLAGTFIGLAVSVKWLAVLMTIPAIVLWLRPEWFGLPRRAKQQPGRLITGLGALMVWPILIYLGVWWVHFAWLGLPSNIINTNLFMLYHHTHGKTGHPYEQPWLGWLVMWQPFLYWIKVAGGKMSIIWSMPNPWLWWTGSAAFVYSLVKRWTGPSRLLNIFLIANWLPFAFIQRDMFSYHAIPFSIFLILLLAVLSDELWDHWKRYVLAYIVTAVVVWLWFLPWYLNLPLSPPQYRLRTWLPTWHIKPISLQGQPSPSPLFP